MTLVADGVIICYMGSLLDGVTLVAGGVSLFATFPLRWGDLRSWWCVIICWQDPLLDGVALVVDCVSLFVDRIPS